MFRLNQKVTVITGGASGIGKAMATLFAKQGAIVYIIDVDEKAAKETLEIIKSSGGTAGFRKCNIALKEEVDKVIESITNETGGLDIVINNAGIAHIGNAENVTPEEIDLLIGVNIKGVYHIIQATLPYLKRKGGVIINMASVAALVGLTDRFAYTMTKSAVTGMTLSIAKDYLKYNIRCNSISPARVHTPFVDGFLAKNYPGQEEEMFNKLAASQPIGRMANPEEVAYLALYLCSNEASFITGCDYPIDGGFTKLNS
jgi:2-keto-3-deoxy-L-fuconate dehydrogenase